MRAATFSLLFVIAVGCAAQDEAVRLRAEMERIHELDQRDRENIGHYGIGTAQRDSVVRHMTLIDSLNTARVGAIIDSAGWLGPLDVGERASRTLWLVIQHAPLAVQERYVSEMRLGVEEGKASAADLAYLEDRIEMRNGRPQTYGSQVNMENGISTLWTIKDAETVNERRAAVGLGPLEKYAAQFGIDWSPPAKKERVLLLAPGKP
jgi:hypothetical protein